jgi:hypothetical protein
MLRLFDRDIPVMGFVYHAMSDLTSSVLKVVKVCRVPQNVQDSVHRIVSAQWEVMHQDIHAAAYLLNPKYHQLLDTMLGWPRDVTGEEKKSHKLVKDELLHGLKTVLFKLAGNPADTDSAFNEFKQFTVRSRVHLTLQCF